jgi:hypothetical protein
MATPISQLKGTTAELAAKIYANGVLVWDETKKRFRGHDGVTAGGIEMTREDEKNDGALGYLAEVKTADYGIAAGDIGKLLIANKPTAISFPLANAATLGSKFVVAIKNIGNGLLTLTPSGAETIDGAATLSVETGNSLILKCDGTTFRTIGASAFSGAIHAAGSKATIVDADEFGLWNNVTGLLAKVTFANLLSSIFNTSRKIAAANFVDDLTLWANGALTKGMKFNLAGITAGQTRSIRIPDFDNLGMDRWELIRDDILPGSTSTYDVTNLDNYEMIWIIAKLWPSIDSGIFLRVSTDNGATFLSAAGDYGYQWVQGSGAAAGANSGNGSNIPLSTTNSVDNSDANGIVVNMLAYNFNKAARCRFNGTVHMELTDATGLVSATLGGRVNGSVARNALRLIANSGNLNGTVRILGWRG